MPLEQGRFAPCFRRVRLVPEGLAGPGRLCRRNFLGVKSLRGPGGLQLVLGLGGGVRIDFGFCIHQELSLAEGLGVRDAGIKSAAPARAEGSV